MYIVALMSKASGEPLAIKRNLSKLPRRFDNLRYAEQLAFESNRSLPDHAREHFEYLVVEDTSFYEESVDIDDDF